jgi:superfamily II DNA or RNA helicase
MNAYIPKVGMLATVRNRRGIVSAVEPFDKTDDGKVLHLVTVEYSDTDGEPDDTLIWEREYEPELLEPNALPEVLDAQPMMADEYLALLRASRWNAASPFLDTRDQSQLADSVLSSPVYGAVKVDDFQLVPLARAMQMPRVSLLLADDVGLGKTIEAGLIVSELIRKRRIRKIMVITPAALRYQWQTELEEKFSLAFDIVDRQSTFALQKQFGMDMSPWRSLPRVITSYHYLRQPDVLEQFIATCRAGSEREQSAHLPWDLLIVDEAHNLMPSNFGEDSDVSRMLTQLSPWFEHKLFLTATPHNGYTRCFSGLLEQLDPVRFTRTPTFTEREKELVNQVLVRRLKRDINAQDKAAGRTPRFAERYPEPLPLFFSRREKALSMAVGQFCAALKRVIRGQPEVRTVLNFAVEVLKKRLLSCPIAFADSWLRFKAGLAEVEEATQKEVVAANKALGEDIDDDIEREGRLGQATQLVGAWMHPFVDVLEDEIVEIDQALEQLGLTSWPVIQLDPADDARFDNLVKLINTRLRNAGAWSDDERLIVFTEYKTTLDYLMRRLREVFGDEEAVVSLYGGMDELEREAIKEAFNNRLSPVRILVATDAASEGLNLQETARLLLHYEIPWNPSRLEQRNGRLDRHGQARDVTIFHFTSEDDADLAFVARVLTKVNDIREDLGSVGELFDAAFQRRMLEQDDEEDVFDLLDNSVSSAKKQVELPVGSEETGASSEKQIRRLIEDLDLSPQTLRETLAVALGLGGHSDVLAGPDERGRMRLKTPVPPRWRDVVNESLRLPAQRNVAGAMPSIVFDVDYFIETINGRQVFRHSNDTILLHLGHPLFRQALTAFARLRFPGSVESHQASRWVVTRGKVPEGADAAIILTVEEMAVNELRETFHHWLRSVVLPINGEQLGDPYIWPAADIGVADTSSQAISAAREYWEDFEQDCRRFIISHQSNLNDIFNSHLEELRDTEEQRERDAFRSRIGEISALKATNSIQKLEREIEDWQQRARQSNLFENVDELAAAKIRDLDDEIKRRTRHFDDLLERLTAEQERVLKRVIPNRFQLRGSCQVFPVTVEIRLPENA